MNKTLIFAAAAFLLAIGTAYAVDPPDMKEGLWSVHSQSIDNPGNKTSSGTYTLCRSHAYDQVCSGFRKNHQGLHRPQRKLPKRQIFQRDALRSGKYRHRR